MAYDDDFAYEETEKVCKVYDSDDFFTVAVQLMLAAAALLSLWFKRQSERPRRKFRTWFLDIAKQAIGACYAHVCNMVSRLIGSEKPNSSESDVFSFESSLLFVREISDFCKSTLFFI